MMEWHERDRHSLLSDSEIADFDRFCEQLDAEFGIPGELKLVRIWVTKQLRQVCGNWAAQNSQSNNLLISNRNLINELLYQKERDEHLRPIPRLRFMLEASEAFLSFLKNETSTYAMAKHAEKLPHSADTTIAYALRTRQIAPKVAQSERVKLEGSQHLYEVFLLSEFCARSHHDIAELLGVDVGDVATDVVTWERILAT